MEKSTFSDVLQFQERKWSICGNEQQFFPQQMPGKLMKTWKINIIKNPKIIENSYWYVVG